MNGFPFTEQMVDAECRGQSSPPPVQEGSEKQDTGSTPALEMSKETLSGPALHTGTPESAADAREPAEPVPEEPTSLDQPAPTAEDVPTAANSRAFFLEQEKQRCQRSATRPSVFGSRRPSLAAHPGVWPSSGAAGTKELDLKRPVSGKSDPGTLVVEEASSTTASAPASTLIHPPNVLVSVAQTLVSVDSAAASVQAVRIPVEVGRIVGDITSQLNEALSLLDLVENKFRECGQVLRRPSPRTQQQWKILGVKGPVADTFPILLFDRLLSLFGTVKATCSVWKLSEDEAQHLGTLGDELSLDVAEFQRRVLRCLKQPSKTGTTSAPLRSKHDAQASVSSQGASDSTASVLPGKQSNETTAPAFPPLLPDTTDALEACVRLSLCLVTTLRTSLRQATSRQNAEFTRCLGTTVDSSNPVLRSLFQRFQELGVSVPAASATGPVPIQMSSSLKTAAEAFVGVIRTTSALENCMLCRQLFSTSEMTAAVLALHSVRACLEEQRKRQRFNFCSLHWATPKYTESGEPLKNLDNDIALLLEEDEASGFTDKDDDLETIMATRFTDFARALSGFYRLLGAILGGTYEDLRIQEELNAATVLGSYLSMVGFMYHHTLETLSYWLSPFLPFVRAKLKETSLADRTPQDQVNSTENSPKTQGRSVSAESFSRPLSSDWSDDYLLALKFKRKPSTQALLAVLEQPADTLLANQEEMDAILQLFLPYLHPEQRRKQQRAQQHSQGNATGSFALPGAPSERTNRLLIWLAWEGDILKLNRAVARIDPMHQKDDTNAPQAAPKRETCYQGSFEPEEQTMGMRNTSTLSSSALNRQTLQSMASLSPSVKEQVVEAITASIVRGYTVIKKRLWRSVPLLFSNEATSTKRRASIAATPLKTSLSMSDSDLHKGEYSLYSNPEEITDFCHRVSEALTLRLLGEVDLKATRDIVLASTTPERLAATPRMKACLIAHLGRAIFLQKSSHVSPRIIECFPKLLGDFFHQSICTYQMISGI